MKTLITYILGLLVFLPACNDPEPRLLTPDLVEELHAYDLGNNGNASDIRVDFTVKDNLNVDEYRVYVVPAESRNLVDEEILEKAPRESYWTVFPEAGFQFEYTVTRLPEDLLDISGLPIRNNTYYFVLIMVIAGDKRQLSGYSRQLILRDLGVYSGVYHVFVQPTWFFEEGSLLYYYDSLQLTGPGNTYQGTMWGHHVRDECPEEVDWGNITFSMNGSDIGDFTWSTYWAKDCTKEPTTIECQGLSPNELSIELEVQITGSSHVTLNSVRQAKLTLLRK